MSVTAWQEELMSGITESELTLWTTVRSRGGSTAPITLSYAQRDRNILHVAKMVTETFSQTIRHIYYICSGLRLVGKDHGKETYWYSQVADIICKARWAGTANSNADEVGTIDWEKIVDDTRPFTTPLYYNGSKDWAEGALSIFSLERWKGQPHRVIICTEKDSIKAMLTGVCHELQVPLMSFHGQASDGGGVYPLAKYIADTWRGECESVICLYLGDFDPSGMSIDRAVFGDLQAEDDKDASVYARAKFGKVAYLLTHEFDLSPEDLPKFKYERIGIVPADVANPDYSGYILPASTTDTNFKRFIRDYPDGRTLGIDALDHRALVERVRTAIDSHITKRVTWDEQDAAYTAECHVIKVRMGLE